MGENDGGWLKMYWRKLGVRKGHEIDKMIKSMMNGMK